MLSLARLLVLGLDRTTGRDGKLNLIAEVGNILRRLGLRLWRIFCLRPDWEGEELLGSEDCGELE